MRSTILKLLALIREMEEGINEILADPEPEFAHWERNMIDSYKCMISTMKAELASIKG